ncbi:DUF58 domain-containing protein [Fervidicoccus fontis]|uniref:DUF58 domain-containing protein n=1 Tax=Fervidicoccus fontis TaxID=683846 RepID=A0A843ADJ2_9CREN|nr:DUF58 domain-containing protein [Fervidicoccus fontis]MBE9391136.1 DUF58 domain-containing protein [Fervidicoccus fontis]
MKIKIGKGFFPIFFSSLSLFSLYLVSRSIVILSVFLIFCFLLVASLFQAFLLRREKCEVNIKDVKAGEKFLVYETPKINIKIDKCKNFKEAIFSSFVKVEEIKKARDKVSISAKLLFNSSGEYDIISGNIFQSSIFDVFRLEKSFERELAIKVLPQTLVWIVRGLRLLGLASSEKTSYFEVTYLGEGIALIPNVRSGEYIRNRFFEPGDVPKRIDWKSSMKNLRLIIREYGENPHGSVMLLVDYTCAGLRNCDLLASSILSISQLIYEEGINDIQLYENDSSKVMRFDSPLKLLGYLTGKILEKKIVPVEDMKLHEYVYPLTLQELYEILSRFYKGSLLIDEKGEKLSSSSDTAIFVSNIFHDPSRILDSISRIKRYNAVVITPDSPWKDEVDIEDAYRIFTSYSLAKKKIEKLGVKVISWKGLEK